MSRGERIVGWIVMGLFVIFGIVCQSLLIRDGANAFALVQFGTAFFFFSAGSIYGYLRGKS